MTLPRNPLHWPDDALHDLAERVAMRVEHIRRPLTRAEQAEVDAWAVDCVRRAWRVMPPETVGGAA